MGGLLASTRAVGADPALALHVDATLVKASGHEHEAIEVDRAVGIEFWVELLINLPGTVQNGKILDFGFNLDRRSWHFGSFRSIISHRERPHGSSARQTTP